MIDVIFNTLVNFPPTANGGWFFRNLSDASSRLWEKRELPCHEDGNVFVPVHHAGGETGCYQAVEACRRISTYLFVCFYRQEHFHTIRMIVLILPPLAPRSEPQSKQKKDREPASTWIRGGGIISYPIKVTPHPQCVEEQHTDRAMDHFKAKTNPKL